MLNRCYFEENKAYELYGGRGIKVCEEWRGFDNFMNFYNWAMNNGYKEDLQLDRIDPNSDYGPNNCRWATATMNAQNQNIRKDNTSGVKGVNYDKRKNLWVARITVNGKRKYLGRRKKFEDAVKLRKDAEKKYWK